MRGVKLLGAVLLPAFIIAAAAGATGPDHHRSSLSGLDGGRRIVTGQQIYSYARMESDLLELSLRYEGLIGVEVIGSSVEGRSIYAARLGRGEREIMINGSHHAYEHMTTNLNMKMLEEYALAAVEGRVIAGECVAGLLEIVSIVFVPMVNPDGVELVQGGGICELRIVELEGMNAAGRCFRGWKANIRGVDLNRQYPALWDTVRDDPGYPAPANFRGESPLSEPESRALYELARESDFLTAVSYHSSGNVIFARLGQEPYNETVAGLASAATGYRVIDLQHDPSGGGFSDWFVTVLGRPAITPEIAPFVGPRPVPLSHWPDIWRRNREVGIILAAEAARRPVLMHTEGR